MQREGILLLKHGCFLCGLFGVDFPAFPPTKCCICCLNGQLTLVVGRREGSNVHASLPKSFVSCLLHQSLFFEC